MKNFTEYEAIHHICVTTDTSSTSVTACLPAFYKNIISGDHRYGDDSRGTTISFRSAFGEVKWNRIHFDATPLVKNAGQFTG